MMESAHQDLAANPSATSTRTLKLPRLDRSVGSRSARLFLDGPIRDWENISHPGIARCVRFIALNFHRPIRVTDLEQLSGLSQRGFIKAFQRHTGMCPGQLLIQLRIELAKRLLAGAEVTLAELALACGFRRMNSFSVTFRQEVGMSPMQFHRQAGQTTKFQSPHPPIEMYAQVSDLERTGPRRAGVAPGSIECQPGRRR